MSAIAAINIGRRVLLTILSEFQMSSHSIEEDFNDPDESIIGSYTNYVYNWLSSSLSASTSPNPDSFIPDGHKQYAFDDDLLNQLPAINLKNRKADVRKVLTLNIAESLRQYFPTTFEISNSWKMMYSLDRDGSSLNTLYRNMAVYSTEEMKHGFVLIVQDTSDCVFGIFFTDPLKIKKNYFGTGESFLYWIDLKSVAHVYPSTGKNDYYILCQPDMLAFGGGGNGFGLSFNDSFQKCMTAQCDTFNNLP